MARDFERFEVILESHDPDMENMEMEGFYFPEEDVTFAFDPNSGFFTAAPGYQTVITEPEAYWTTFNNQVILAFNELLDNELEPTSGKYYTLEDPWVYND